MTENKNQFIDNLKKIQNACGLYIADAFTAGGIEYITMPFYLDTDDIDTLFEKPYAQAKYLYFKADDIQDKIYRLLKDERDNTYKKELLLVSCGNVDFSDCFFTPITLKKAKEVCKVVPLTVDYYERIEKCL